MTNTVGSPAARRCAAGIVFALETEADAFESRASARQETLAGGLTFHEGLVAGRRVAWVVSGAGIDRATRACRQLIAGHRPQLIVSAGFTGALSERVARGQVVGLVRAFRRDHDPIALAVARTMARAEQFTILTVDHVICTPADKRSLAAATGADLIDMETWGVAQVAHDAGLECVGLRVVSDAVAEELPREMATLVQPQSSLRRFGAALRAIGRRPGAAVDMWRLWENAVVDARTLAAALEPFIGSLPIVDP